MARGPRRKNLFDPELKTGKQLQFCNLPFPLFLQSLPPRAAAPATVHREKESEKKKKNTASTGPPPGQPRPRPVVVAMVGPPRSEEQTTAARGAWGPGRRPIRRPGFGRRAAAAPTPTRGATADSGITTPRR